MIKEKLAALIGDALKQARAEGDLDLDLNIQLDANLTGDKGVLLERPRDPEHGDLSCALPLQIAALAGLSAGSSGGAAEKLAQSIASHMCSGPGLYLAAVSVRAPGFINFKLSAVALAEVLSDIVRQQSRYGFPAEKIAADDAVNWASRTNCAPDADIYRTYVYCRSVLRQAQEPRINILSGLLEEPLLSPQQWRDFLCEMKDGPAIFLDLFSDGGRLACDLILELDDFPRQVRAAGEFNESARLRRYTRAMAQDLRRFCGRFNLGEGLFCSQLSVLKARLGLIFATKQVLGNALGIIELSAPERI